MKSNLSKSNNADATPPAPSPATSQVQTINIADIDFDAAKQHQLDGLQTLQESIEQIGLRTPITVRSLTHGHRFHLVAGGRRLAVATKLGWPAIPAFVEQSDEVAANLWSVDENFVRTELSWAERAELFKKRKSLVAERLKGAQPAHPRGGNQPHDRGLSRTARDLGLSREMTRRLKLISTIPSDVLAQAKSLGIGNNASALMKIAKLPQNSQVNALETQSQVKPGRKKNSGGSDAGTDSSRATKTRVPLHSEFASPPATPFVEIYPPSTLDNTTLRESKKDAAVLTEARQIVEKYLKPILVDASPYVRKAILDDIVEFMRGCGTN